MSTRSQIIIKETWTDEKTKKEYQQEQWFYRHSDGYPSGNLPQLYEFMQWIEKGLIRRSVEQSCGWLVLIGAKEYGYTYDGGKQTPKKTITEPCKEDNMSGWKYGAYEICPCKERHGDIEWLYTINLVDNTITIEKVDTGKIKKYAFKELKNYSKNFDVLEKEF